MTIYVEPDASVHGFGYEADAVPRVGEFICNIQDDARYQVRSVVWLVRECGVRKGIVILDQVSVKVFRVATA